MSSEIKNILVIRLSAMGDVALSLPVIRMILRNNPNIHITLLTKKPFHLFFENIENLDIVIADTKNKHKGLWGIFKLWNQLIRENKIDFIVDLHSVIRSYTLDFLFFLGGKKIFKLKKNRKSRKRNLLLKNTLELPHITSSYSFVFKKAGLKIGEFEYPAFTFKNNTIEKTKNIINTYTKTQKKLIGFAPFAAHELKTYPFDKTTDLCHFLVKKGFHVFLFGGGKQEIENLNCISQTSEEISNISSELSLDEEISLISQLDVFLSMDSSNMHIASMCNIPVFSIWGATHPFMGYAPLNQPKTMLFQIDDLNCRPCSVYGKGECKRGDFACMEKIDPKTIADTISEFVQNQKKKDPL